MSEQTPEQARRALLQQALKTVDQLQARLAEAERARHEPIAIIGLGCRFPGGADTPDAYWQLLDNGVDAITEVPPDRWSANAYAEIDPAAAADMPPPHGGFLRRIDQFDPYFFGITPKEAIWMDPQQRLALEVAWEALEHAAIAPASLRGSQTGVFLGITAGDYGFHAIQAGRSRMGVHIVSGITANAAAGRIAYFLGLHGPCMAIDTACSSALSAIHVACQSLRNGESRMVIAGGVNALVRPEHFVTFHKWGMLAPDGRCKTFDGSADGFVRAEGCGIVVMKRLRDAIADKDRVLAVIRGSAVNQDGASGGLTVPNGAAQQAVIRQALAAANVTADDVDYVEAHGTGTSLGDPIELEALDAAMSEGRAPERPLMVGSVKTNVGHLEAASGIASLIKVVLALNHDRIPRHLQFTSMTPKATLRKLRVVVPTANTAWPRGERRRLAGVSGFGFSGTNVHVVVEEPPTAVPATASGVDRPAHIVALSAKSPEALRELAGLWQSRVGHDAETPLADIAYTANTGRSHFAHRTACVASTSAQLCDQLAAAANGAEAEGIFTSSVADQARPKIAFLFTGQGAQYSGMGRELYDTQPTFRRAIDTCAELLRPHMDRPLLEVLQAESAILDQTIYTQPALFAVEYALAELWRSWGVSPDFVLGHSVGEFVAACVAGALPLEDALRLIASRARLMNALPAGGAMSAVFATEDAIRARLAAFGDRVSIAAINAPDSVVVSGEGAAVAALAESLTRDGIVSRPLSVSHAFHSALMAPMLDELEALARSVRVAAPRIGLVSNLTGALMDDAPDAKYWRRHAREAVQFTRGMRTLAERGCSVFVEIGPSPTLMTLGRRSVPDPAALWVASSRRGQEWREILSAVARLYARGVDIDWRGFDTDYARNKIALPTYPFQRQRYWIEAEVASTATHGEPIAAAAALPGSRIDSAGGEVLFQARVNTTDMPFLSDHVIGGRVVFPATAYIEWMIEAAQAVLAVERVAIEDLVIADALIVPAGRDCLLQLTLAPRGDGTAGVQIFARDPEHPEAAVWRRHAAATVRGSTAATTAPERLAHSKRRCRGPVETSAFYEQLAQQRLEFGPAFRTVSQLWRGESESIGYVGNEVVDRDPARYQLHPALLDGCLQVLGAALPADADGAPEQVYVPIGTDRFTLHRGAQAERITRVWSHAWLRPRQPGSEVIAADVTLYTDAGEPVAAFEGLRLQRFTPEMLPGREDAPGDEWLYEVEWAAAPAGESRAEAVRGTWLVVGEENAASPVARAFEASGSRAIVAAPDRDFKRLFADLGADREKLRGVVYMAGTPSSSADADAAESFRTACGSLLLLAQALIGSGLGAKRELWAVTRGAQPVENSSVNPAAAPVWGMMRAVRVEHPELRAVTLDLDATPSTTDASVLVSAIAAAAPDNQIAIRGGRRYAARLVPCRLAAAGAAARQPVELAITTRGTLDNLRLRPLTRRAPRAGEAEIEVLATGLNFRDVLNALGMYPGDPGPLGNECVGVVARVGEGVGHIVPGQTVMALTAGAFGSFVTVDARLIGRVPEGLSVEEAATIPIVFMTAVHSLVDLARLQRGQRVLIHAGAGGVGLAAIQVAQQIGAEIFATAGSPDKRALLRSIGVPHVFDSRSLAFAADIATITGGRGVDVVLNSLAGEFIPASLATLAPGGVFVELGKTAILDDAQAGAQRPDVKYFAVYLGDLAPGVLRELLARVTAAFASGAYHALPLKTFELSQAQDAFRYMAQARHVGKIVIMHPAPETRRRSTASVRADATYLVTGGMGGVGLKVIEWLADRGAGHIAVVGRRGPSDAANAMFAGLHARGVHVHVLQGDVSRRDDVARILSAIDQSMPPLRGVFHAAGVLDDGVFLQQDWSRFEKVFAPKVDGARHLHGLTASLPLDYFVLFSSAASMIGGPGQANYAAANAYLDALAHQRAALGLPALSVNWGPWTNLGMVAGVTEQDQRRWARHGLGLIPAEVGIRLMERLLAASRTHAGVLPMDRRKAAAAFAGPGAPQAPGASAASAGHAAPERAAPGAVSVEAMRALPPARRRSAVLALVRGQVELALGLDRGFVLSPNQSLRDMGMDSLLAVELRNRLQAAIGRALPATVAFDFPTVEALTSHLDEVMFGAPAEARPAATEALLTAAADDDPIAIVGMACRVPGAEDVASYWQLLSGGVDAIAEVPADRWDLEAYYDPDPDAPGKMYCRNGGFLRQVDRFDAGFFGVSPREAASMDPQQRLLLEVSWEALEDAGQSPDGLGGSRTGVFVGLSSADYAHLLIKVGDPARIDAYFGTGNSPSVAAGRLSYHLGLQGPALTVDTACSSSLVAVHLACQSLRKGESRLALAGGVNLMLSPDPTINFSRARMLAPDGRCKTFDADADGYVRGEGAGVVVLKRLSDANRDGDRVLAVIRGSAVNQDGRSSGLTVPNGPAQQALLAEALSVAGVQPHQVSYVEAHGTGTSLGDPIEVQALAAVLCADRPAEHPLVIGSVKTNIGHLEAAAGVAGLIKVVLAMQHAEIPPHLHFRRLNPHISLDGVQLVIPTALTQWEPIDGRRIAGLSAFGFSGTNAHVVIEQAGEPAAESVADRPWHPITLSAKTEAALDEAARRLAAHLRDEPASIGDVAFTLNTGRAHMPHRIAFAAATAADAQAVLHAVGDGRRPDGVRRGVADDIERPDAIFVFADESTEFATMGRQLAEIEPVFQAAIERCEAVLAGVPSSTDPAALARIGVFTFEYALAQLWQSWGVTPAAVIGHGVGEHVAACVAGVLRLEDGLKLAAGRAARADVPRAEPAIPFFASDAAASAIPGIRIAIGPGPRDRADWPQVLATLADAYVAGIRIDWAAFDRARGRRRIALPAYPFQRQRYWIDSEPRTTPARRTAFDEAVAAGRRQANEGPLDLAVQTYGAKWRRLEDITDGYIARAMRDVGAFTKAGQRQTVDELLASCGIQANFARLLSKWLDRLVSRGLLQREDVTFVSPEPLPDPRLDEMWAAATELVDVPAFADYIRSYGESLPRVITGRESALEPLFPGGSFHVAKAVYEDSAPSRYINAIAASIVDGFARGRGTQPLRVLEVGAGTGSTTAALLPTLPAARTKYWFTDLSDLFLGRAREKFAEYDFVRYGILDVERDPAAQGYPAGGFDVIVAANVIHATSDLRKSLGHLRQLLAPGGAVVLYETTVHHAWFDITTGLLEGWQRFDDGVRTDNPLVGAAEWQRVLAECGFEHPAAFPQPDSAAGVLGLAIVTAGVPAAAGQAAVRGFVDEELAPRAARDRAPDSTAPDSLATQLREASRAERDQLLVDYVRRHVAGVLALDESVLPERRQRLMDLGLDSLMAVELHNRLASAFGGAVTLPATLMFDYPTIEAIAAFIGRELGAPEDAGQPRGETEKEAGRREAAAKLAEVSEEEAEALLIQRLEML